VGPRAGVDWCGKSCPHRDSIPGPSSPQPVAIPTELSRPTCELSGRLSLKCDGTCAGTRFRVSVKRTSPFKSAGASVQSTTGSRGVRISRSNAGYTMFRGSVKSTGYPLHSPVSPSFPLPCVTMYHHISTGLYSIIFCVISRRTKFVTCLTKQVGSRPTQLTRSTACPRKQLLYRRGLRLSSYTAIFSFKLY
jgi:hypothetical protein